MAKKRPKKVEDCILAIDAGTQSIRAILIDLKGNMLDIIKTPIEPYFSKNPGWAEQDPEYYWKNLCTTTKKLMKETTVPKEAIKGVTLTTQRDTMINVDRDGKPLRPAIVWLDQRSADKSQVHLPGYLKLGLKAVNMLDAVEYFITEAEANWIRQNQPDVWDKTHKFLFLSGFFTHRLTGEYVDSTANQVGFVPFDNKSQTWAKKSDLKWKLFPMDESFLTDVVQPSELLGYITKQAARQTGIPSGLPVIAAAADKACEVLGSGCLSPEIACLSYGTTATIETTNRKYVEVIKFFPSYPSAIPNHYNTEVMIYRGYWMINWFKKEFGHREIELSKKTGKSPEELFDDMIRDIPPGSMGLTLQPYWSPGVKIPGHEAKGAVIGFGDVHTRAHLYRSILEGLTYALKDGALLTQKRTGVKIEKLRVSGGGSQSENALQITADIFDLPVEKPHTYETSALGAAINCAVGLNLYPDFQTAIDNMCRVGETYLPKPENRAIYKKLFNKVYKKMYKRLKPLYQDIRDITNYPKKEL